MDRPPGRQTRPAYERTRRSWYGYGQLASTEKSAFGRFLDDTVYVFGDVSILGLPVLMGVAMTDSVGFYGASTAALVAWMTMVFVGTLVRGGWVRPFATETLGWVTVTPALLALRLLYYNAVLLAATFGGLGVAAAAATPPASIPVAFAVATLATLSFPRLAETVARRRAP